MKSANYEFAAEVKVLVGPGDEVRFSPRGRWWRVNKVSPGPGGNWLNCSTGRLRDVWKPPFKVVGVRHAR